MYDENNLRKKGRAYLIHSWKVQSIKEGKAWEQELGAAGHAQPQSGSREMNAGAQITVSFLCCLDPHPKANESSAVVAGYTDVRWLIDQTGS